MKTVNGVGFASNEARSWKFTTSRPRVIELEPSVEALLPQLKFEPGVHVNYQETVLRIKDGLPKLKDMPKEMGGSGAAAAE